MKRSIVRDFVAQGLTIDIALQVAALSRSTYYYRFTGGKKGTSPSTSTCFNGEHISNDQVVAHIKQILEPEFIDYGYHRVTAVLNDEGYQISKSKVYRLMKEHQLLHPKRKGRQSERRFVVFTSPRPNRPFEVIETDIKYVYIYGEKRNAYLITMLDTFHRQVFVWGLFADMKTDKIVNLIVQFVDDHLIPNSVDPQQVEVTIRSDNGSQFVAQMYQDILHDCHLKSNYIPPACPQMNGHIEAFHSTIQRLVCSKYVFETLTDARLVFDRFYHTYNNLRIMKSILNKCPVHFLQLWNQGYIGIEKRMGKNSFYFKEEGMKSMPSPLEASLTAKAKL